MNIEERKRLRELSEKATPGPWTAKEPAFAPGIKARVFGPTYKGKFEGQETMAVPDAEFIAAAREAVPALLDDVDRLEAENAALKARVEKLEEVRKAAAELLRISTIKLSSMYQLPAEFRRLRGTLDRANKENQ